MQLDPADLTEDQIYSFMCSAIVPRPIAWVSTVGRDGATNLAPFSYFTGVCCVPMTVLFCPVFGTPERPKKDTLANIEEVPEFVINIAQERTVKAVNHSGAPLERGVSEFDCFGLTQVPSARVGPPRVGEADLAFECAVKDVIEISDGPGGGWVVLGAVLALHAEDGLIDPESMAVDLARMAPVARLGGRDFLCASDVFSLPRFRSQQDIVSASLDAARWRPASTGPRPGSPR
jgi:flavin reductase (DIM6/NTAB) family NADH-FMN oxidoreductase RutF